VVQTTLQQFLRPAVALFKNDKFLVKNSFSGNEPALLEVTLK